MKRTKKINRSRIMNEIWLHREISRSRLAKTLRLDKSTVSNNINELLDLGIIEEKEEGAAGPQGGRKPIIIRLNQNFGCVLGIELRPDSYTAVAVDVNGEILYSQYEKLDIGAENLKKRFLEIAAGLQTELERKGLNLLGIGIGMSGVINAREGIVKYSIPFAVEAEYPFIAEISSAFDVPVFVDNDANACVWGELVFHRQRDLQDCLFLLLEIREHGPAFLGEELDQISVGVGLVINGRVHYGHDYSAGEFRSIFRKNDSLGQFDLTAEEQARLESDPGVQSRFLRELGANISLLVNTFNLTHIILGGDFERYGSPVVTVIEDEIKKNWPYPYTYKEKKHIWFSSFGDKAVAYGAAGSVLDKIFSDLEILEEYSGHLELQTKAGIIKEPAIE